ncbi:MAG: AAA family ATPase [Clostridiales bacterium]|nr:AAA family ATPase [Clostridiales bacterium]
MGENVRIITVADVEEKPAEMLAAPYIPAGKITLVLGTPGEGKTAMMLAIVAALTNGAPLFGNPARAPARAMYYSAEDGLADTIRPRLRRYGADLERVHSIDDSDRPLNVFDGRIEQAILATGAAICVIDPIQGITRGVDLHSANAIRPAMSCLAGIAGRSGCAVCLVGHLNKKGGGGLYRGLGSIDIMAAARSALFVGRLPSDGEKRAFVHAKSNLAAPGTPQAFGFESGGALAWLGPAEITLDELLGGKAAKKAGCSGESQLERAMAVIECALESGECPASEAMRRGAALGICEKTMKRAKSALGVRSARRAADWVWIMPEEGQEGQPIQSGLPPFPREHIVDAEFTAAG